jgi:hypothetical protein
MTENVTTQLSEAKLQAGADELQNSWRKKPPRFQSSKNFPSFAM